MPRVDFYVLPESLPPHRFACTMSAKARRQGLKVCVFLPTKEEALGLNDLMWTFSDISFLPHCLADESTEADEVGVVIGWPGQIPDEGEVLINLDSRIPDAAASFDRIVEPVAARPAQREDARERFRKYRELGWELYSHELDPEQSHA